MSCNYNCLSQSVINKSSSVTLRKKKGLHMELAEWLMHWAAKLVSRVRCPTRSHSMMHILHSYINLSCKLCGSKKKAAENTTFVLEPASKKIQSHPRKHLELKTVLVSRCFFVFLFIDLTLFCASACCWVFNLAK